MRRTVSWTFLSLGACVALAVACSSNGGSTSGSAADASTCTTGDRGCECYANGTCNSGLACQNTLCVASSSTSGTSGQTGTSGSQTGSSTGSGAGTSGVSGTTSGASGTTSGASGTSTAKGDGSASCDDTQNDWQNCGACGHVCSNMGQFCAVDAGCVGVGCTPQCCAAGQCYPFYGPCIAAPADGGTTTCAQECASIGASCVTAGCGGTLGVTWLGWDQNDVPDCQAARAAVTRASTDCNTPLTFGISDAIKRCCCSN